MRVRRHLRGNNAATALGIGVGGARRRRRQRGGGGGGGDDSDPTTAATATTTAVLLPLIDSANHSESASDSRIEYDPLRRRFELWIGPDCLVREEEQEGDDGGDGDDDYSKTQLYIRYGGNKSDREWLLNYGFLPGVGMSSSNRRKSGPALSDDEYRRTLAEAFLRRNS